MLLFNFQGAGAFPVDLFFLLCYNSDIQSGAGFASFDE